MERTSRITEPINYNWWHWTTGDGGVNRCGEIENKTDLFSWQKSFRDWRLGNDPETFVLLAEKTF